MNRLPNYLDQMIRSVFNGQGKSSSKLRGAIKTYVESLLGTAKGLSVTDLPDSKPGLQQYIRTVAQNAYRVTDADIQKLKQEGYSEDEIYELTVATALASGLARLERGQNALKGAQ